MGKSYSCIIQTRSYFYTKEGPISILHKGKANLTLAQRQSKCVCKGRISFTNHILAKVQAKSCNKGWANLNHAQRFRPIYCTKTKGKSYSCTKLGQTFTERQGKSYYCTNFTLTQRHSCAKAKQILERQVKPYLWIKVGQISVLHKGRPNVTLAQKAS